MRKETKTTYIFETEEEEMLKAVKKMIAPTSEHERVQQGLTEKEAQLVGEFYNLI